MHDASLKKENVTTRHSRAKLYCDEMSSDSRNEGHSGRGSFLRKGDSQLLPGAGAPWDPCFNGFPFLGKKGLFLCLFIYTIQHAPVECLPCARYDARCGRTAVSGQMCSLPFGLNSVVVWGKQWLCFLPTPHLPHTHTPHIPHHLCPFFQLSVPHTLLIPEVCISGRRLQEE